MMRTRDHNLFDALEPRTHLSTAELTFTGSEALARIPTAVTDGETAGWVTSPSTVQRLLGVDRFWADPRFSRFDGAGYSAVIVDTGINRAHPFFGPDANRNRIADRIVYSYDYADRDADATDRDGHGTNVSSIVGSSDADYPGMAPGVNLIHLKVFSDKSDRTKFADVEVALQWIVRNVERFNIASVNLSLGDEGFHQSYQTLYGLSDELAALAAKSVIVCAAAGNSYAASSIQGLNYPAADPNVLAVGAVYSHQYGSGKLASQTGADRITDFSQRTTNLWQIFAPGAPIAGAGPAGKFLLTQQGTSQASPHVAGIAVLMQQLADRVLGRRLTVPEFRSLMMSSGKRIIDGDDERDAVRHTRAAFRRVDAFAMANAIWKKAGAEVVLRQGAAVVKNGGVPVTFGSTTMGTSVVKSFTIENAGARPLKLSALRAAGGFSIAASFGAATLQPGESTTFAVRLDGAASGTFKGSVRFKTNDKDERRYKVQVSGSARSITSLADDGTPAVRLSGNWTKTEDGYGGDQRLAARGDRSAIADWTFANLLPGMYRVSATWTAGEELARDATYLLSSDGSSAEASVDQRLAPAGESGKDGRKIGGAVFRDITVFEVAGSELIVSLGGSRTGVVAADAIAIERVGTLSGGPHIVVTPGQSPKLIADGGSPESLSSTPSGRPVLRTLLIRNAGGRDLMLDSWIAPDGFSIVIPPAVRVRPGTSTTLTLQLDAGAPGAYSGPLVLRSNDDEHPAFRVNLTGTVSPVIYTIDNGDAGFSTIGEGWNAAPHGFRSDELLGPSGGGDGTSTARWSFQKLKPGLYRVAATWPGGLSPSPELASNAEFRVFSGGVLLANVVADQRVRPSDETSQSVTWMHLGMFRVTGDDVLVILDDLADGSVIADALRVERIGN